MIHSLGALPVNDARYERAFYVYLLDYGWEDDLSAEMYQFFPRMADAATSSDAVVLRGTVGHHFADEVLAWHHVNGAKAEELLPGILVTTKHPQSFREHAWRVGKHPDRLLLIPLRGLCRSPRDVGPLLDRMFSDIKAKRRLSEFDVSRRMVAGREGATLDAIVLKQQSTSVGIALGEVANFFDAGSPKRHMNSTSDTRADVLLVTVTKVETTALLDAFGFVKGQDNVESIDGRIYFDLGIVNGARVRLTRSEMGAGGLGASQQSVQKGIAALSPTAVIMVGIAFGVNDQKQSIGDVLVTEQLRPYELQRVGTGEDGKSQIILRDDKPHSSSWLLNLLKSSEVTWNGAALRFGTVLTGAKLVDNFDFREELRAFDLEAIGGEMEGAGLYVACHDQKVDWILVKAICDFADGEKAKDKAARQTLAAKNAAAFVRHALEFVKVDWAARHGAAQPRRSSAVDHAPAPKFFVYLSDSKLHMLASQLPSEVSNAIANSNRTLPSQQNARLHAVIDLLRSHRMIGTVDEPGEYVEGTLDMRWGQYGRGHETADGLVYFGGESERTIVGLGGSARHVIGTTGKSHPFSHSATPALVKALLDELVPSEAQKVISSRFTGQEWVSVAVELATTQMTGPLEKFEFVAKVLHKGESRHQLRDGSGTAKILLATPLYVASRTGR